MLFKKNNQAPLPELQNLLDNHNSKAKFVGKNKSTWKKTNTFMNRQMPRSNWLLDKKNTQDDDEKLYSIFRSLLNKLTDKNLDELSDELINSDIQEREHLEKLVDFVFHKSITESNFATLYAILSKKLIGLYVKCDDKKVYFRELLIKKCQNMFVECISIDTLDELSPNFKRKSEVLGCVMYVGELYNQNLLTDKIINSCFKLIFAHIELKKIFIIDILCTFIKTVGKKFSKSSPNDTKIIFNNLSNLKDSKAIELKEKFAIMDLIDMKNKEWN